ncbi:MAG TPA: LPS export ABC transporter periplasmic protein LptC [Burkholderiaceae bacterium]|nr:LPS export ABC transporter periplasmic protein LptC [Burkholderiaceae bacterium]
MNERGPAIMAGLLLLALVAGTWWAADYAQRAIPVDPPARLTHEPDSWARTFVMIQTNNAGMPVNRLEGRFMRHYPDDDSYEVDDARAVNQRADAPITIGSAKLATMNSDSTLIVLTGDAHVHRLADAERAALDVTSNELTLLTDEDIVKTALPARVVHGSHTMEGIGMRYDNRSGKLQVFSASDVKLSGQDTRLKDRSDNNENGS